MLGPALEKFCACFVWVGIVIVSSWGGFLLANAIGRSHAVLPTRRELKYIGVGMALAMVQILSLGEFMENSGSVSNGVFMPEFQSWGHIGKFNRSRQSECFPQKQRSETNTSELDLSANLTSDVVKSNQTEIPDILNTTI